MEKEFQEFKDSIHLIRVVIRMAKRFDDMLRDFKKESQKTKREVMDREHPTKRKESKKLRAAKRNSGKW